ncbi:MAG: acyl-CoA dehydrogenase family protein [Sinimarinibacterium sp.]
MSPELIELRDSARQVLGAGGLSADESKTWSQALELGWLLVAVPEGLGGLGQGLAGASAFYAEFGRSLNAAPYVPAMLGIDAVCHAARADRANWLERLTTRDFVTASLGDARLAITNMSGGKPTLRGTVSAVPSADRAAHVLVCSADEACVALVPMAQAGVERTSRPTWDATRRLFDLRFTDVEIDSDLILASGSEAQALSRRLATHRDFALASDAVGGASAVLDMTIEYLQTRRQFGRPLALFQALKHRCADLKAQVCAAEALLLDSLSRVGEALETVDAETLGRGAKFFACSVYARVAEEALQLHGGIGMTAEHTCHRYLKRALLDEQLGRGDRYALDIADAFLGGL